jgi:hypothetical protein
VLRDGSTLDADLPHQLGAPENPMTAEQVRDKFRENAALAGGSFEALEQAVLDLEECHDVHAVLSQLGGHAVAA